MIQVAFAGHNRPHDLGRHGPVITGLDAAFAMLKQAGVTRARLLTGLANGADELAAAAWRRAGLGPIHAVFPFLQEPKPPTIGPGGAAESATWLDGATAEAQGRNPHLKQTRMIVETADLVVVVWTGEKARGAGGTADAVLRALELGLPVLWVRPGAPHPLRLIRPEALPLDFHFPEFQEALQNGGLPQVEDATPGALSQALGLDRPTQAPTPTEAGERESGVDAFLDRTVWKTYSNFRKLIGGKISGLGEPQPLPGDLAQQPGFVALDAAYLKADHVANRLSAIHRSEQILLVLAMIAAAVVGSAWAVWPELKLPAVWIELALAVAAVLIWASAQDAHQHEKWSEQRYLAEQLRLERAGWAVGVSLVSAGAASPSRQEDDRGRDIRRDAGLPHGRYDAARVSLWGRWAMSELIDGQAAYHRANSVRDHRIGHRIHMVEDISFLVLFASFAGYVALHMALPDDEHLPHWISGVVSMIGTIVPALAAASMALEAKLEFKEQSERSERIADALDALAERVGTDPTFDELQNAARAAMRLHIAEASHWREGTSRRRLFRP